jgi:hypothetical protein
MKEEDKSSNNRSNDGLTFYYSREERIRKRHKPPYNRKSSFLFRKKRRGLIIILVDVVLIAIVLFFVIKPANILLTQKKNHMIYELNITGIRGGKVLVGFTIRNEGLSERILSSDTVTLRITDKSGESQSHREHIKEYTMLMPGESSSTVFLLNQKDLPRSGLAELYYGTSKNPLFSKNVRF